VNATVWHAVGTYATPAGHRTAIILEDARYDLETAALHFKAAGAQFARRSLFEMLTRWDEAAADLAILADLLSTPSSAPAPLPPDMRFAAPYVPPRIFCTASNFVEHANEMGTALAAKHDSEPYIFIKASTTIIGPGDVVVLPEASKKVDWEVELAAVIGRGGRNISVADAHQHVAAYAVFNDVSARDQGQRTDFPFKQDWFRQKSYDTFGPFGPWIVPAAMIADPQDVSLKLQVNETVMQDGSTRDMIFTLAEQIAYLSRILTLEAGDMIATGTPTGVGMGRGIFLKDGDVMTASIPGIGALQNPVRGATP